MENIKLLGDRVLIEVNDEITTDAGLILSKEEGSTEEIMSGEVVAVGPGKYNVSGMFEAMGLLVDAQVVFQYGQKITLEGKEYMLVREDDIILTK